MQSKSLKDLPVNKSQILNNITCPYCGVELTKNNDTREHVIGRRFVPKGSLDGKWNLIVRACDKCNKNKSDLEDDISAITLIGRQYFDSDEVEKLIISEIKRKAESSISRKTGKPVKHSQEELNFKVQFSQGATFSFNLVSPPQLDNVRLFELARMHLAAFFYFITFNQTTKKGGFWLGGFHPISGTHYADWGNNICRSFMKAVVTWEPIWIGHTADGFFKSIIRRHPHEECWSWALEWNKNYRLIGFFGEREPAKIVVNTFQTPEMKTISTGDNSLLRFRQEVCLSEKEDLLFVWGDVQSEKEST